VILTPGEMVQTIASRVPERAFAKVRFESGHEWCLTRIASEDLTVLDKRVDPAVRACPTYWAGIHGETAILVHPRPDRPYEVEFTAP